MITTQRYRRLRARAGERTDPIRAAAVVLTREAASSLDLSTVTASMLVDTMLINYEGVLRSPGVVEPY